MSSDLSEGVRRAMARELNVAAAERDVLEKEYGQVWDTAQLATDFDVLGFAAPLVVVRRKSDGAQGSLLFQHMPRYYFGWSSAE